MPKIMKIHDNIATIKGKYNYQQDQFFKLAKETYGVVISATEDEAKLLIVGDPSSIKSKVTVNKTKNIFENVSAMSGHFGSIISPFGHIIHPEKKTLGKKMGESTLDNNPPLILNRVALNQSLPTGILTIDTMIPIGKGQRELIIGDRKTGKTSIALSTIINQRHNKIKTIYVSVGQKRSSVINTYNTLMEYKAEKNVAIIFANPDSSSQQLFAPRIGMAMAEAIAYNGEDVLLIIDDLTKHANVYREIALSIGKNPGREAYPTDIFYRHARLLERAGRFNQNYKNGSITCLPIVETIQGDIASLIPSNIISITDGQIFTSTDMFNKGKYPAINIGLSVSRTGSPVQGTILKKISKGLKAKYSALFDIKKFADMSIDIPDELKSKMEDWIAINNIILQYGFKGYHENEMMVLIKLFEMKKLEKIIDPKKFSIAFSNFCGSDIGAKKILKMISIGKYNQGDEVFRNALETVFVPLVKIASGYKNDIITQKEFMILKGGE